MPVAPLRDRIGGRIVVKFLRNAVFTRRLVMCHPGAILYCQTRRGAKGAVALPVGGDRVAGMEDVSGMLDWGDKELTALVGATLTRARRLACPLPGQGEGFRCCMVEDRVGEGLGLDPSAKATEAGAARSDKLVLRLTGEERKFAAIESAALAILHRRDKL